MRIILMTKSGMTIEHRDIHAETAYPQAIVHEGRHQVFTLVEILNPDTDGAEAGYMESSACWLP